MSLIRVYAIFSVYELHNFSIAFLSQLIVKLNHIHQVTKANLVRCVRYLQLLTLEIVQQEYN